MRAATIGVLASLLLAACQKLPPAEVARQRAAAQEAAQAAYDADQAHQRYMAGLYIVRVCQAPARDTWGRFVQQGPDGRLWVSYYARPSGESDSMVAVAPGLNPVQVC